MQMTAPVPEQWHVPAVTASLSISGGILRADRDQAITEHNEAGLKLVLLLGGELRYSMQRHRSMGIKGPAVHLSLSRSPFTVSHSFHAATPLQYVAVRMPEEVLQEGLDVDIGLHARQRGRGADTPFFLDRQANRILQALGRQLLACPLRGNLRDLYLAGKALELTSSVLAGLELATAGTAQGDALTLSPRQLEALHEARALLLEQLSEPPGLAALGRQVGLNVTTLTRGFRTLFGCSVYQFVRDQRLELAYRMLAAGRCSVAHAASAAGYSDSHFSKAFQKRFGIAPRGLRR
ncbi:Regulatory protein PchR [Pigmentiphaga humi]|uniref:Regulatory protein PchR n=1 Tax=Pigmentiphaga humi TaxID=2478468 RepID=A0A3P4B524_9BURK|nr:AraC family transcriptional regulator [Pigmentiphaga humi]VCU71394.1 Regulatory protein PchR [Pigmentiphaga humi]